MITATATFIPAALIIYGMNMIKIDGLNTDFIKLEVGCDGPSLPILTIMIGYNSKLKSFICLDKDQAIKLSKELQSLITEM